MERESCVERGSAARTIASCAIVPEIALLPPLCVVGWVLRLGGGGGQAG